MSRESEREELARLIFGELFAPGATMMMEACESIADRILSSGSGRREDGQALRRYRAVTHWIGADSWDGCSDCIDRLQWATQSDLNRDMTPDEVAAEMRPFFAERGCPPPPAGVDEGEG